MLTIRIFLSSPGDVADERRLAVETMRALQDSPLLRDRVNLRIVAWDDPAASAPLDARETPQSSVNRWTGRPADCDLTVVILWSRLGTPLPAHLKRSDGSRFASGTVWEVEDAISADRPVFVYRRTEKPRIELDDADFDARRAQYDAVQGWLHGLRERDGAWRSGVNEYLSPAQFQQMLRVHLESFIGRALAASANPTPDETVTAAKVPAHSPSIAGSVNQSMSASAPRRWLPAAAVAGLLGLAAIGWLFRPGPLAGAVHSSFRLLVDGVPRAPYSRLNELVDSGESKDADITFDVPDGTKTLALRVLHYSEMADLPLILTKHQRLSGHFPPFTPPNRQLTGLWSANAPGTQ